MDDNKQYGQQQSNQLPEQQSGGQNEQQAKRHKTQQNEQLLEQQLEQQFGQQNGQLSERQKVNQYGRHYEQQYDKQFGGQNLNQYEQPQALLEQRSGGQYDKQYGQQCDQPREQNYDLLELADEQYKDHQPDPDFYGDAGLFDVSGIAGKMRTENSLQPAEQELNKWLVLRQQPDGQQNSYAQASRQSNYQQPNSLFQTQPPTKPQTQPQTQPQTKPNSADSLRSAEEDSGAAVQAETETIRQFGETQLPQSQSNIHVLSIVGEIEGHIVLPPQNKTTKYEHIIPQLVALEQDDNIEGTIILLNTVGGDVEAGLAIAEMIASMSKPTVSIVLGGGHSIGVPIAVATDYSFITDTASMTIHPIRLNGMVIGVPQTYEYLDKMQDRVVSFVVNHSHVSEKNFRELMFRTGELARDIGTVLIGKEAVDTGLIDEVGGLGAAVSMMRLLIEQKKGAGVYQ